MFSLTPALLLGAHIDFREIAVDNASKVKAHTLRELGAKNIHQVGTRPPLSACPLDHSSSNAAERRALGEEPLSFSPAIVVRAARCQVSFCVRPSARPDDVLSCRMFPFLILRKGVGFLLTVQLPGSWSLISSCGSVSRASVSRTLCRTLCSHAQVPGWAAHPPLWLSSNL
jgi:hypothetical protein